MTYRSPYNIHSETVRAHNAEHAKKLMWGRLYRRLRKEHAQEIRAGLVQVYRVADIVIMRTEDEEYTVYDHFYAREI